MDYLVCPIDGASVKVVERRWGPEARPLVSCPECGKTFRVTPEGTLDAVVEPD